MTDEMTDREKRALRKEIGWFRRYAGPGVGTVTAHYEVPLTNYLAQSQSAERTLHLELLCYIAVARALGVEVTIE